MFPGAALTDTYETEMVESAKYIDSWGGGGGGWEGGEGWLRAVKGGAILSI